MEVLYRTPFKLRRIVKEAMSITPIRPAKIPKMPNAQPSTTIMTMDGSEIRRYSPQLVKESLLGHYKDSLRALIEMVYIATIVNKMK